MQLGEQVSGNDTEVIDTPVVDNTVDAEISDTEVTTESEGNEAEDDGGDITKEMKTIKKALNKKNRYIDNQRQRLRNLEAEEQRLKSSSQEVKQAPQMEKFDSIIDYMKAEQSFTLDQKLAEQAQATQLSRLEAQKQIVRQEQTQAMAETMSELLNSNPDVKTVITKNSSIIQGMPPHIESLMYEIDDAPAATYALAKEGRLQDLYYMPPHIAAAHLVQAEIRGQQYLQQSVRPRQTAPEPIGSLKGTGVKQKSISSMSADEIVKRYIK